MDSLKTIQTIMKILKILTKVAFIACIVGGAFCLFGLVMLFLADYMSLMSEEFAIGLVTPKDTTLAVAYCSMLVGLCETVFGALIAHKWNRYYKMEEEDGTWVYSLNVNDEAQKGDSIMFYTNHQSVHVYNLNEECYSLLPQDSIWSHSTGSTWNMFKIPNGAGLLRVEVKRVYEEMGNVEVSFYAGEPTALTQNVVKDSIVGVIVSLVIVICGLILFFYWVYVGENRDKIMGVFYFSFFCITLGLWSLGETQAAMILVSNRPMASYVGYIFIYFLKHRIK